MWCDVSAGRCEPKSVICVLGSRRGERPVNVLPPPLHFVQPNPKYPKYQVLGQCFINNHHCMHLVQPTPQVPQVLVNVLPAAIALCATKPQVPQVPSAGSMFYQPPPLHLVQPSNRSTKCWVNVLPTTSTSTTAPSATKYPKYPRYPKYQCFTTTTTSLQLVQPPN